MAQNQLRKTKHEPQMSLAFYWNNCLEIESAKQGRNLIYSYLFSFISGSRLDHLW